MLMRVMVRYGRETAHVLSVNAVGKLLMLLDLTEIQPGFARIGAS